MEPDIPKSNLDEDLDFTQSIRRRMASSMTQNGVPTDNRDRRMLLEILDGMDRSSIGRKTIKNDEDANGIAAAGMSDFLMALHQQVLNPPLRVDQPVKREIKLGVNLLEDKDVNEHMLSSDHRSGKTSLEEFTDEFLTKHPEYASD